jgi:CO dehydrogenase maturation factor
MKIAVSGKGGVGKTTIVAILCKLFKDKGLKVFAIDADPDTNLAQTLGFTNSSSITPLVEMKELIKERLQPSGYFFKLNPKVDDIPDKYFTEYNGIRLAVMGTVRGGGLGCTCPENTFLKALLGHLLVERKEVVILDMEAGIEHLGRGTVKAVDLLIIVVEPTFLSIQTALRINKLASDIGIKRVGIIGNKIQQEAEKKFIIENLKRFEILGFISYDEKIKQVTITNKLLEEGKKILDCIIERI